MLWLWSFWQSTNVSHPMHLLDQQWFMPILAWEEAAEGRASLLSLPRALRAAASAPSSARASLHSLPCSHPLPISHVLQMFPYRVWVAMGNAQRLGVSCTRT